MQEDVEIKRNKRYNAIAKNVEQRNITVKMLVTNFTAFNHSFVFMRINQNIYRILDLSVTS